MPQHKLNIENTPQVLKSHRNEARVIYIYDHENNEPFQSNLELGLQGIKTLKS